jgi:hypothetical protein
MPPVAFIYLFFFGKRTRGAIDDCDSVGAADRLGLWFAHGYFQTYFVRPVPGKPKMCFARVRDTFGRGRLPSARPYWG